MKKLIKQLTTKYKYGLITFACMIFPHLYREMELRTLPYKSETLSTSVVWITIVICTALILNKIESQKPKDKDQEEKDEEATP